MKKLTLSMSIATALTLLAGNATAAWHGHGGGWSGHGGGWYGPRVGVYFGGAPWFSPWPYYGYYGYPGYYPYRSYYAYPPYYAYPAYSALPPPVYIQRPPAVVASAMPPPPPSTRISRQTLSAHELFAFDSALLRMPQPKLDEIAAALTRHPEVGSVTITGYTDRLGSDSYNRELSQQRANAVKAYLVGKGVAASRLAAIGKGKADPVVQCRETTNAALIQCLEPNRRVEVEQFTVERRVASYGAPPPR